MHNDQEPPANSDEERREENPAQPDVPLEGTETGGVGREGAGRESALSSDAGWREALSDLGVDVDQERTWQGERPSSRGDAKPESKGEKNLRERGSDPMGSGPGTPHRERADAREGRSGMDERSQWMGEAEMSIEKLYELFDAAYMECDLDEDGDLRVVTDSGPRVFLSLHEPNKLLRYMAFYKFRDEAGEFDKLLFVNALNDDIVFIRFSLNGNDTLIADYYLPYARGASPFHIVNAAKLMGRVITSGIRQHDTNNLLE